MKFRHIIFLFRLLPFLASTGNDFCRLHHTKPDPRRILGSTYVPLMFSSPPPWYRWKSSKLVPFSPTYCQYDPKKLSKSVGTEYEWSAILLCYSVVWYENTSPYPTNDIGISPLFSTRNHSTFQSGLKILARVIQVMLLFCHRPPLRRPAFYTAYHIVLQLPSQLSDIRPPRHVFFVEASLSAPLETNIIFEPDITPVGLGKVSVTMLQTRTGIRYNVHVPLW